VTEQISVAGWWAYRHDMGQARHWYQRAIAAGGDTGAAEDMKKLDQRAGGGSRGGRRRHNYGGGGRDDGWQGRPPSVSTPQGPGFHMGHGVYIVPGK
jgi:hypothetical protein